jgi:hypothetical protein
MLNGIVNVLVGGLDSWKSSLVGLITFVLIFLNAKKIIPDDFLSPENQKMLVGTVVLIVGWLVKDNNKTGKPLL